MADSNDFSDFKPENTSFRVFRTRRNNANVDKLDKTQKLTQPSCRKVLRSQRKRSFTEDNTRKKSQSRPTSTTHATTKKRQNKSRSRSAGPKSKKTIQLHRSTKPAVPIHQNVQTSSIDTESEKEKGTYVLILFPTDHTQKN
jgi:hypothetical protein